MTTKRHWQPKMDKSYLIDDLNDWLQTGKIEYNTQMTIQEIETILYSFEELRKQNKP